MQEYHGPAIGNEPWQFDTACFVDDHIGSGDGDSWQQFRDQLGSQSAPVFVEYLASDIDSICCLPLQTYYTAWTLDRCVPEKPWQHKTAAFNFSVNKRIPSRDWMMRCLDETDLVTTHYTKSWSDSGLHPRKIYSAGDQLSQDGYVRNGSTGNLTIFESWLRHRVYEPTVVSLVTEPVWDQPAAFISEKTVFAVESGTIPIWCGGWGIADAMRELGFDVFDDIVNHDYQYLDDAKQRVTQAIELNQTLLGDQDQALAIARQVLPRLERNRWLMRSGAWFRRLLARCVNRADIDKHLVADVCMDLVLQRNYEISHSCRVQFTVSKSLSAQIIHK